MIVTVAIAVFSVFLFEVAVIVALPSPSPVTTPLDDTVATNMFEDDQLTSWSVLPSVYITVVIIIIGFSIVKVFWGDLLGLTNNILAEIFGISISVIIVNIILAIRWIPVRERIINRIKYFLDESVFRMKSGFDMFSEKEIRGIIKVKIDHDENLGEQVSGSGHLGYTSYEIDQISKPEKNQTTLYIETEFTSY